MVKAKTKRAEERERAERECGQVRSQERELTANKAQQSLTINLIATN